MTFIDHGFQAFEELLLLLLLGLCYEIFFATDEFVIRALVEGVLIPFTADRYLDLLKIFVQERAASLSLRDDELP